MCRGGRGDFNIPGAPYQPLHSDLQGIIVFSVEMGILIDKQIDIQTSVLSGVLLVWSTKTLYHFSNTIQMQ